MKTLQILRIAGSCGALVAILWLVSPLPVVAQYQSIDPGPLPRIISPANHAVFYAPVDIPIFAYSLRTNLEFYAGTNDLGRGYNLGLGSADRQPGTFQPGFVIGGQVPRLGRIYYRIWTNAPPGDYALTVVTSGPFDGADISSRTSPPVNINILVSPTNPNPTNVVSIVATDPIAVAGTNWWIWPGMTNATPAWTGWPPPRWQNFTNWGPKDALFTVRRFDDTSSSLTVNYSIGGTASNGVDYAELPGNVTIPAGGDCALIPIVPINNGATNFAKTVILTLAPDTNTPPDYLVGIPPRAVAVILDYWRRPMPILLPDGSFHFNVSGPDGAWFSIQNSRDLQNWLPVGTNQVVQGSIDFVNPEAPDNSSGFYRILQLTHAPAN